MTDRVALALLGGPESGKTTYLAALSDRLMTSELPYLEIERLGDTTGLSRLSEPLLEGKYPQRTKGERLHLQLRLATRGERFPASAFDLHIGDYDGEEVERLFKVRTGGWTQEWQDRAESRALLLFIRPNATTDWPRMTGARSQRPGAQANPLLREHPAPTTPEDFFGARGFPPEAPPPRSKAADEGVRVPTCVAVIELLQFIRHVRRLRPGVRPVRGQLRIALVASAWDEVDASFADSGPAHYFSETAALLEDYLWSNFHEEDVFRFGLSATGGDLHDPVYRDQYASRGNGGGHVVWCDANGQLRTSPDLSVPLCWAAFGDRALE